MNNDVIIGVYLTHGEWQHQLGFMEMHGVSKHNDTYRSMMKQVQRGAMQAASDTADCNYCHSRPCKDDCISYGLTI